MKISVRAKPNSKTEYVEEMGEGTLVVAVKEPPVEGRANAAIIRAIADHFGVSLSQVRLLSGPTSRNKIFERRWRGCATSAGCVFFGHFMRVATTTVI